jgi:hypothetical protein
MAPADAQGRGKHQSAQPGGLSRGQFNRQRAREGLGKQDEGMAGQLRPQPLGQRGVILPSLRRQRNRLRRQPMSLGADRNGIDSLPEPSSPGSISTCCGVGDAESQPGFPRSDSHVTSFAGKHRPHRQAAEPLLRLSCCFAGQG